MNSPVLFIHGAGTGAYAEDRLLADSLQSALGAGYDVQCPQMPDEENVPLPLWMAEIDAKIAGASGAVALVGHSAGGAVLLKYLCDRRPAARIPGLFLIATPYCSADEGWQWDDAALPADAAAKLAGDWPIVFYHSRDDEIVPFAHLALHAARLPRAQVRAFDGRGHQFGNDLAEVGADIRRI
jgi:predicted alpha/beta hydrolase family esterase